MPRGTERGWVFFLRGGRGSVWALRPPGGAGRPRAASALALLGGGRVGRPLAQRPAVGDPALVEVVRRDRDGHDVAGQDADEVLADLAGDVRDDLVPVVQADAELRVGQGGDHLA